MRRSRKPLNLHGFREFESHPHRQKLTQVTMPTRRGFVASGLLPFSFFFNHKTGMAGAQFQMRSRGTDRRRYIWIHGNEKTAGELLAQQIKQVDGRAFLVQNSDRNVDVEGGKLDPNRMFSRVGAEANLRKLNPAWTAPQIEHALHKLDHDRPKFLRRLLPREGQVLLALHNNSEGYSVNDEVPISDRTSIRDKDHPHEFLLCTNPTDFDLLAGGPFNVVLQNTAPKDDDGSLSRLCAVQGIRYVNIEAALGNAAGQRRMLDWAEAVLL